MLINSAFLVVLIIGFLIGIIFWQRRNFSLFEQQQRNAFLSSQRIFQILLENLDFATIAQKIADTIPKELQFGTGVLAILDEEDGTINRIAASNTKEAHEAIKALSVPFDQIKISINDPHNLMARALREKKPFMTENIYDVLGPVISQEEASRVQKIMSTRTTFIYPIYLDNKPLGVFLASTKKTVKQLTPYEREILSNFTGLVGLAIQNSRLYTSLKNTNDSIKGMTRQIYEMNAKLHQLDKLKDDFVSVASHELRTPMTAIRSYTWMALHRSDIPLSQKLEKYLYRTLLSTERLINLVNDMLNVSRIESGRIEINPVSFDIAKLVSDVMGEVKVKAEEKRLQLIVLEHKVPPVFADPDKVHQVLLNLIGNALKFSYPGGQIAIDFFTDGKMVEVSVKDTGLGIAKDDLGKLFKKFGRLDNSYISISTSGGTGLGLFISKNLVELMHGRIWAESEGKEKGAKFTFSLPVVTKELLERQIEFKVKAQGEAKGLEPVAI